MTATNADPYALLEAAWDAEDPTQARQLFQEAARQADLQAEEEAAVEARRGLLHSANALGDGPTLLTAFGWLLAHTDADPNGDDTDLLWRYKWAIAVAMGLPSIPLTRLNALLDDFESRTRQSGLGDRTANIYRWKLALHRGDLAGAEELRLKLKGTRRKWLDCAACDTDLLVRHHLAHGDLKAALKAAQPVLSGRQSCNRVPNRTHTELMLARWQAGQRSEAQEHHCAAWAGLEDATDSLTEQSMHLAYLHLSGQAQQAAKVRRRLLALAARQKEPHDLFWWHAANALADGAKDGSHLAQAREIAARFDGRNGTPEFTRQLDELLIRD